MAATDLLLTAGIAFDEAQVDRATRSIATKIERTFALGRYTTDFKQFEQSIDAAVSRVTAFGLTAGIFFTVKNAMMALVSSSVEVEKGLTDINVILGLSSRNLKTFSDDLFKVATSTGQTFAIASKAATEFSRQNLSVEETLKRTRDALNLSRLSNIDAMTAVADLTSAMNSFGDSILDSTQLISKFVAVDQRFAVSAGDIAEAIKRVGSTAQDAGLSVDQLIGIVTALQEKTGRGGAVIAQGLKTIFTKIQNPTILDQLEGLGVKIKDLGTRQLLPTLDILENVSEALSNMGSSADKFKVENLIGNLYQINQLKALIKDLQRPGSTSAEATKVSAGANFESLERSGQMNQTLSAEFNSLTQNMKNVFSQMGNLTIGNNLKLFFQTVNEGFDRLAKVDQDSIGARIGRGILKGIGTSLITGAVGLANILIKIGASAIEKVSVALKSFTDVQIILRDRLNTLKEEQGEITKINLLNAQRLEMEREILSTVSGQRGRGGVSGGGMRGGGTAGVSIGRTAELMASYAQAPTTVASALGRMGYITRRINQAGSIIGVAQAEGDTTMLRMAEEEIAVLSAERDALRRNINPLRIKELTPQAEKLFGYQKSLAAIEKIDPLLAAGIASKRASKMQNLQFGIGFAAPMIAEGLGELGFGGESKQDRIARTALMGVGQTISAGAVGTAMSGGTFGIIAATITGLVGINRVFHDMNDILPELNVKLENAKNQLTVAEQQYQTALKLTEQAAGFRSGAVKNTPENQRNYKNQFSQFMSGLNVNNMDISTRSYLADAIISGDQSKVEGFRNQLIPESIGRTISGTSFMSQAAGFGPNSDIKQLLSSFYRLQTKSGRSMESVLGSPFGMQSLGKIQPPGTIIPGSFDPSGRPSLSSGNFEGLADLLGAFGIDRNQASNLFENNPRLAQKLFENIKNRSSSTFLGAKKVDEMFAQGGPLKGPDFDTKLVLSDLLYGANIRNAKFAADQDLLGAIGTSRFATMQGYNKAKLENMAFTESPLAIAALGGQFNLAEAGTQSVLAQRALTSKTGTDLLSKSTNIFNLLNNEPKFKQFSGFATSAEMLSAQVAKGNPESMKSLDVLLDTFKEAVKGDQELLESLSPHIADMKIAMINYSNDQTKLNLTTQERIDLINKQNEIDKKNASPFGIAQKAFNQFGISNENEKARLAFFESKGALFADERASGSLRTDVNDIALGKLSGKGVIGASIGGFSNQLKFGIKDMYRELREGADEVGASLKSSFKDAFKSFLDGSQSASNALRSLGLSFANKLLDIAAQGTTNLLFGGLQNLGSAAYAGFKGPSTGATGGYVTGGSGIRDDVPAMLNEGDFVIRKSSVSKYGVGFLDRLGFAGGGVALNPASPLSNFALSDENNPQNRIRMEQESADLNALIQYQQALDAYNTAKNQRRLGALINLGVGLVGAGISSGASAWKARQAATAQANYNEIWGNVGIAGGTHAMGGEIKRYYGGGSVDNVPALLTGGEYVVNRNAVSRLGVGFMHRLNRGEIPMYNTGGFVGEAIPTNNGGGESLNDSISRLINSNEKLRSSMEKGGGSDSKTGESQSSSPIVGNISISINIDKSGNAKADVQTNQQTNKTEDDSANQGKRLGEIVKATVLDTLIKETRNGGILEQNFQRRR